MPNNLQHSEVVPNRWQSRQPLDRTENLEGVLKSGESARASLERRLKAHVSISESGCWEWTGCLTQNGYPQINFKRRAHYAHRLSYATFVGPIPVNLFLLHGCDNPKCINPQHLRPGDQKANIGDAVSRKRHAFGVRQGKAKLTDSSVFSARSTYAEGKSSIASLAVSLGVSIRTLGKAIRGDKWKHVPFPAVSVRIKSTVRSDGSRRGWTVRKRPSPL